MMPRHVPYGSREWLRRLHRQCRPVGALRGTVVVKTEGTPEGSYQKCVGGSPEAPSLITVSPDEMPLITWVTGPFETGASRAWDSRLVGGVGAEDTSAASTATPWIFGGLLLAAAFGVAAMEKKMGGAR